MCTNSAQGTQSWRTKPISIQSLISSVFLTGFLKEVTWHTKRAPSFYTTHTNLPIGLVRKVAYAVLAHQANQYSAFTDQLIQTSEKTLGF